MIPKLIRRALFIPPPAPHPEVCEARQQLRQAAENNKRAVDELIAKYKQDRRNGRLR